MQPLELLDRIYDALGDPDAIISISRENGTKPGNHAFSAITGKHVICGEIEPQDWNDPTLFDTIMQHITTTIQGAHTMTEDTQPDETQKTKPHFKLYIELEYCDDENDIYIDFIDALLLEPMVIETFDDLPKALAHMEELEGSTPYLDVEEISNALAEIVEQRLAIRKAQRKQRKDHRERTLP